MNKIFIQRMIYLFITIILSSSEIYSDAPLAPSGQLINLARNDKHVITINDGFPVFGWIMNDKDKNEYQSAYQILVASSQENIDSDYGDMWDSEKFKSSESSNITYPIRGKELQSGRMYFWKVRTWDKDGNISPYSTVCKFITSLNISDWIAKPIWDKSNKFNEDVASFAFFRKKIILPNEEIKYAIAFITSRDARIQKSPSYKFYINNKLVGIGPFQGYKEKITYIGYDITNYLNKSEENILSAICESSVKEKDFLLQIYIKYNYGDTTIITDKSWKSLSAQSIYNPHGTKTSNAYHYIDPFESIDSRNIPNGWMEKDFNDSKWSAAAERHEYYNRLLAVSKPAFEIEEITPKEILHNGNGNYKIVLGSGYFGWFKLKFNNAIPGDTILIRGEQDIFPWTVVDWEKWIIANGSETIEQFGYVWTDSMQINGYNGPDILDESNIKFIAIRNPFDDSASDFHSSNNLLNEIFKFCKISMKNLNVDYYWDTPQNERLTYEGGAIIQQMTSYTMDRDYAMPRFATEYQYYEPTWPYEYKMQSVWMGWEDYLYTGNINSIKNNWEILKEKKYSVDSTSNYLIKNISAVALDWPKIYQDGYDNNKGNTSGEYTDNIINAWNYIAYHHLSLMAHVLSKYFTKVEYKSESLRFSDIANAIRINYNQSFLNNDLKRYVDGLNSSHAAFHSSFMPVVFDMVPQKFLVDIADYLATRNMDCGVYGSQFFLWALYNLNKGDRALELITSTGKNSWYNMIYNLNAANTCEAWDPSGKDDMSKSHAWGSSAGNIIQRGLMGINPLEPGFKKISIKPQIGNLEFAKMKFPTIKGTIEVNVYNYPDSYNVEVNIPANTTAKVFVKKINKKDNAIEVDGNLIKGEADESGEFIIIDNVGSGLHLFKRVY
jgi:alpha-L-rhamnosidase